MSVDWTFIFCHYFLHFFHEIYIFMQQTLLQKMGTLLKSSKRCRFCGEEVEDGLDLYSELFLTSKQLDDDEDVATTVTILICDAAFKYLKLKLDPESPFPKYCCPECKMGLQAVIDFSDKLELGQVNMAKILITEGIGVEVKKRGRPRKGFEKVKKEESKTSKEDSSIGKRKIKVPKKFEETVHELKNNIDDTKHKVDIEEKNADLEEYRLNIDEGDGNEEFTVSIDMSNLSDTKTNPGSNPVLDEINSILTQFDKKERADVSDATLNVHYCEVCDHSFPSQECLNIHVTTSHGQIMYKCDLNSCNALLKSREELRSHQLSFGHKDFIILEIGSPKDSLKSSLETLKDEIVSMDNIIEKISDKFRCSECEIDLHSQQKFNIHMAEIHGTTGAKVYPCTEQGCSRTFTAPSSLTYHKFSSHNKSVYFCTEPGCNKSFKMKNLLTRHLKTHSSERTFACEQCDKSFKTRSNLYSHTIVHQQEPKFFCDECGQQFKHRTSLTSHMRWHQGEKPFKCPFCPKTFNQNGNLQEHVRIHTGEKPFKCELCPRAFTTSSQHRLHVKRHMGVKQFKCEFCGKAFLNKDTFKTHLRRHKGEKPYGCKFCKKSFAESWALTKHLRFHTGQQPYLCKECGKRFSDSSNLAKHKKIHDGYLSSKSKQTVWNIVKDAGEGVEEPDVDVIEGNSEVQQVIYIAYENGEQKAIEGVIKDGQIDIAALAAQGISVETEADISEDIITQEVVPGPLEKMEQMEYKEHLEPHTVKLVQHQQGVEQNNQTIDLTMKDGHQIRLVAPLNIDPLTFATEYIKDLQQIPN